MIRSYKGKKIWKNVSVIIKLEQMLAGALIIYFSKLDLISICIMNSKLAVSVNHY